MARHAELHRSDRVGWLRAGVLGANDGLLSVASLVMGVAEGGIMPITQTLIAAEVDPEKRGLAHGITQNFGANPPSPRAGSRP